MVSVVSRVLPNIRLSNKKCQPTRTKRHPGFFTISSSLQTIHTTVQAAPTVVKAFVQLAALVVGAATGGTVGVIFEEEIVRKGKGGFMSGIYGLLIGSPIGAALFSVLVAMYVF